MSKYWKTPIFTMARLLLALLSSLALLPAAQGENQANALGSRFSLQHRTVDSGGEISRGARFENTSSLSPFGTIATNASSSLITRSGFAGQLNEAPIAQPYSIQLGEASSVAILLQAIDAEFDPIAFRIVSAPTQGTLTGTPPFLIYLPGANFLESDTFTFVASDGADSAPATFSFTRPAQAPNVAPVILPIADQITRPGVSSSFSIIALDPDRPAQNLAYLLNDAPPGASLDPTTGLFTWTPSVSQPTGPVIIRFTVRDDGSPPAETTGTVQISVVNDPPSLEPVADREIAEGNLLTFALSASDPNAPPQSVAFSLDPGAPAGAVVDPTTGVFSWSPSEAQGPGTYPIQVRVADNAIPAESTVQSFTITVREENSAPTISPIADRSAHPGVLLSFPVIASDADRPAQNLAYLLTEAPPGADLHPTTGVFTWTPPASQSTGPVTIRFTVRDDGSPPAETTATAQITVVNDPPSLEPVADREIAEGNLLTFALSASDPNALPQSLTFSIDPGAPAGAVVDPTTGVFSWTPTETQGPGTYPIQVRVADNAIPAESTVQSFTITVREENSAPAISPIADRSARPGVLLSFSVVASDTDLPLQNLTYQLTEAPAGALLNPTNGLFTWTPSASQAAGPVTLRFTVRDDGAPPAEATGTVQITVFNDAPSIEPVADVVVDEGKAFTLNLSTTDANSPPQTLTFSLASTAPAGVTLHPTTGVFSWTSTASTVPGNYPVTVQVSDNGIPARTASRSFTVTVLTVMADYAVTTTSDTIGITDTAGNADTLDVTQNRTGTVQFTTTPATRTFRVNGGNLLVGGSGALSRSGIASITINAGAGNDAINVSGFTGTALPALTIHGGSGNDTVTLAGSLTLAPGRHLDIDLQNDTATPGADSLIFEGGTVVTLSGTGNATFRVSRNVVIGPGADIRTIDGDIVLEANQQTTSTSGNFEGILVQGTVRSLGRGDVTLSGRGGSGTANGNHGVRLVGGTVTSATGTVTLDGQGGGSGGAGATFGTFITSASTIASGGSRKTIVRGTGGSGNGSQNQGVVVTGGVISSGGGDVEISGFADAADTAALVISGGSVDTRSLGGDVLLSGDRMQLDGGEILTTSPANVTLRPLTPNREIFLGGADNSTGLGLTDAELDRITAGSVTVGDASSGPITVRAVLSPANFKTLILARDTTFGANGGFASDIGPTATNYESISALGTVTALAGASIGVTAIGGYEPALNHSFILIANNGLDPINGSFSFSGLNPFLNSGLAADPSPVGGDGNDLMLTTYDPSRPIQNNSVVGQSPGWVAPSETFELRHVVQLLPGVNAYSVTRSIPPGWAVALNSISHQGSFDAQTRTIHWGPFTDGEARTLYVTIKAPTASNLIGQFPATATFNGVTTSINGAATIPVLPHAAGTFDVLNEVLTFGSDDPDIVRIYPGIARVQVVRNGVNEGTFLLPRRIAIFGQAGADDIRVDPAVVQPVEIYGGPGNDTLQGGGGIDQIYGEEGNDSALNSPGIDTFVGGPGQDGITFYGTPGDDNIRISWYLIPDGQHPDVVVHPPFPAHRDGLRVFINEAHYEMVYNPQDDFETIVVHAGAGNDHVEMLDDAAAQHWNAEFHGEDGNDTLIGSRNLSDKRRGNDHLYGGPGNDVLKGQSGNDFLDGGPGQDTLEAGIGRNHLVTDGLDQLTLNTQDTLEIAAVYSRARWASINWGDGQVQAAKVNPVSGSVSGIHAYAFEGSGSFTVGLSTLSSAGRSQIHPIPATIQEGILSSVPGPLSIERLTLSRMQILFPGIPGYTYVIEGSKSLEASTWSELGQTLCDLDGWVRFGLENWQQSSAQFFRSIAYIDAEEKLVLGLPPSLALHFELEPADDFADVWLAKGAPRLDSKGAFSLGTPTQESAPTRLYQVSPRVAALLQSRANDPICQTPAPAPRSK